MDFVFIFECLFIVQCFAKKNLQLLTSVAQRSIMYCSKVTFKMEDFYTDYVKLSCLRLSALNQP